MYMVRVVIIVMVYGDGRLYCYSIWYMVRVVIVIVYGEGSQYCHCIWCGPSVLSLNVVWNGSTLHITKLASYGGDLVSLITFDRTILYQTVSCFSGINVPLVFQSVMHLYFKNVRGK